jgi:hypothetical protein
VLQAASVFSGRWLLLAMAPDLLAHPRQTGKISGVRQGKTGNPGRDFVGGGEEAWGPLPVIARKMKGVAEDNNRGVAHGDRRNLHRLFLRARFCLIENEYSP